MIEQNEEHSYDPTEEDRTRADDLFNIANSVVQTSENGHAVIHDPVVQGRTYRFARLKGDGVSVRREDHDRSQIRWKVLPGGVKRMRVIPVGEYVTKSGGRKKFVGERPWIIYSPVLGGELTSLYSELSSVVGDEHPTT